MRIRDIIHKVRNILPFVALAIAWENRSMGIEARNARLAEAAKETFRLAIELKDTRELIIANQETLNKVVGLTADISDNFEGVNSNSRIIQALINRLHDPNITQEEFNYIVRDLKVNTNQKIDILEKANKTLQEIQDLCSSGFSSDVTGNNFISQLNILIEKYKVFLSTLSVEQIETVINIIGYIIILSSIISIAAVLYGEYLIHYFKLEERFPKIARFIQIRRKFQWYYLNYNFITILLLSLFLIGLNITILF